MNSIDFLPKRLRVQRVRRHRVKRQATFLVTVVLILSALGYSSRRQIAEARETLAERHHEQSALSSELSIIPALQAQIAEGSIKQRISRELGSRLAVSAVLAELGRVLPEKAALTSLEYSTVDAHHAPAVQSTVPIVAASAAEAAARASGEKRVRVVIAGVAPDDLDVADFLGGLSASPLFSDVQMGFSKTVMLDEGRREARGFEVSCLLAR
jgi:Tfp pilus assembly protein PilN